MNDMKTKYKNEILSAAATITVVSDGDVRYPVLTDAMVAWVEKHGEITASNYDQFCFDVECIGEKIAGTPGTKQMTDLCEALVEAGAGSMRLA